MSAATKTDPRWDYLSGCLSRGWPVMRLRGKLPNVPKGRPVGECTAELGSQIPDTFPLGGTWNAGLRLDLARSPETGWQILVLDVDAAKRPGSVAAFQERTGVRLDDDLDGNYRVQTGSALPDGSQPGRHFYFYVDPAEVAAQGWHSLDGLFGIAGLDVKVSQVLTKDTKRQKKGQNAIAYVVLPGSIHPDSGEPYRLVSAITEPTPLPDWARDYLNAHPWKSPDREKTSEPQAALAPSGILTPGLDGFAYLRLQRAVERAEERIRNAPQGERQATTNAEAYGLGYLVQLLPEQAQREAFARISAASAARVTPEDATAAEDDLDRAWDDGMRTPADKSWGDPIEPISKAEAGTKPEPRTQPEPETEPPDEPAPFPLYSFSDMEAWPDPDPIIQGIVCRSELIGLVAPKSSGKSAVALDMALHIAAGIPWNGREVVQGGVVYVAAENAPGYLGRIRAWGLAHGIDPEGLPFLLVRAPMKLDGGDGPRLRDTVLAAQERLGQAVVWTPVDTVRRTLGGKENESDDFQRYVDACDLVRNETGSVVQLVHHTGVGGEKRGRGSSVWGDALAPILGLRASGPNLQRGLILSCEDHDGGKAPKDLEPFSPIDMHLRGQPLGIVDRYGMPISAVVAHEGRHPDAPSRETYMDEVAKVQALVDKDPTITMNRLAAALGGNTEKTKQRLHTMVDDGYLAYTERKPVQVARRPDALPGLDS